MNEHSPFSQLFKRKPVVFSRVPVHFFTVSEVLNLPEFEDQCLRHGLGGISLIRLSRFAQRCLDYIPVVIVEGDVMLENLQV